MKRDGITLYDGITERVTGLQTQLDGITLRDGIIESVTELRKT